MNTRAVLLALALVLVGCDEGITRPVAPEPPEAFATCLALIGEACERTAR